MKNKILIIGPFSDFGGREVEANTLIRIFENKYLVYLFSTVNMSKNSCAINSVKSKWSTLNKELISSSFVLKITSFFYKILANSRLPYYVHASNIVSQYFFNFDQENIKVIKKQINNSEIIVICGVFTNGFFKEIVQYCSDQNKIILFRTTGTVSEIPESLKGTLQKISKIIIHSESNSQIFTRNNFKNIKIIDQTTLLENDLLHIEIRNSQDLIYGYLGRFSKEKGILELLTNFQESDRKILIAGDGPFVDEVIDMCENNVNYNFLGALLPTEVASFFSKIDVLIIPSHEESGPLVAIEAMAAGKIILSTRVGAMMDRLSNTQNQFWFDINDKQSLLTSLEAIETLIGERLISIRKELRKKYIDNYSKNKIGSEYLHLIENIQLS